VSVTTYAELKTAVANWLDDTSLDSRVVECIAMYEAAINRRLAVRQQIASTTLTPSSGTATLPTDFLYWKRVTWTGMPKRELEYVDPSYFNQSYPDNPSDTPRFFTIEGSTLRIVPIDATSLTFVYAQKVPPLATTDPNWLLTANPDFYLDGALAKMETFKAGAVDRPQRQAEFEALCDRQRDALGRLNFSQSGPVMIRAYGVTP